MDQLQKFLEEDDTDAEDAEQAELPGHQWRQGDRAAMLGQHAQAMSYYRDALESQPDDARLNFRLGVVYRMKYDSDAGSFGDFKQAVKHWEQALRLNPNQYIWRRRIQQYGPILDKPYPFYNWVEEARQAIVARGDTPITLNVEPRGAELAGPRSKIRTADEVDAREPDPKGRITRSQESSLLVSTMIVPSTDRTQHAARIHLTLEPNQAAGYAWNNEADPVRVWLASDDGLQLARSLVALPGPATATSVERRIADVEVRWSADSQRPESIQGYVLYHACEKETGVCIYRRKDLTIRFQQ
jgi:tetratricopeptide (TPR) repeat protein